MVEFCKYNVEDKRLDIKEEIWYDFIELKGKLNIF